MDNERILPLSADDMQTTRNQDNKSFLDAVADQKSDARPVPMGRATQLDLDNLFTHHPPKAGQTERYEAIRSKGLEFAQLIESSTPSSVEQTWAIRKIQEAVMWANASIACNE